MNFLNHIKHIKKNKFFKLSSFKSLLSFKKAFSMVELILMFTAISVLLAAFLPAISKKVDFNVLSVDGNNYNQSCEVKFGKCCVACTQEYCHPCLLGTECFLDPPEECPKEKTYFTDLAQCKYRCCTEHSQKCVECTSTECTKCEAGYYLDEDKICRECPKGFYCPGPDPDPSTGEVDPYIDDGDGRVQCPCGTYNDEIMKTSKDDCKDCEEGCYCPEVTERGVPGSITSCPYKCPKGMYSNKTKEGGLCYCTNCSQGKYTSEEKQANCANCSAGYYCPGEKNIKPDPYGCIAGCYCPEGSDKECQHECSCGRYSDALAGSCTNCPANRYCPGNKNTRSTFRVCSAGTYTGSDRCGCDTCPANRYCGGGDDIHGCPANSSSSQGSSRFSDCRCNTGYHFENSSCVLDCDNAGGITGCASASWVWVRETEYDGQCQTHPCTCTRARREYNYSEGYVCNGCCSGYTAITRSISYSCNGYRDRGQVFGVCRSNGDNTKQLACGDCNGTRHNSSNCERRSVSINVVSCTK